MAIGIGDNAPDFSLPGTGGTTYSLSQFRGQPVVIVFYPGDDTPVCTKQLNSYNDELDAFNGVGAQVLAISAQDMSSHEAFAERPRGQPEPRRHRRAVHVQLPLLAALVRRPDSPHYRAQALPLSH